MRELGEDMRAVVGQVVSWSPELPDGPARDALRERGYGRVAALVPDVSVEALVRSCSEADAREAEERLVACAACHRQSLDMRPRCDGATRPRVGLAPDWQDEFVWRDCERIGEYQHRHVLMNMGVPRRFLEARLATYSAEERRHIVALKRAREYIGQFRERPLSLMMKGDIGSGKTFLALAVARELYEQGIISEFQFWFVPKMLEALRQSMDWDAAKRNRLNKALEDTELLILDDVGAERVTDWVRERLTVVINERWANERPIIVTTNSTPTQLRRELGDRAVSRITAMTGRIIQMQGDRRQQR